MATRSMCARRRDLHPDRGFAARWLTRTLTALQNRYERQFPWKGIAPFQGTRSAAGHLLVGASAERDMWKSILTAVLLAFAVASIQAGAQSPAPRVKDSPGQKVSSDLKAKGWRASKLPGVVVYNEQDEPIGKIIDLLILIGSDSRISIVLIDVSAFVGIKESHVPVAMDRLKFSELSPRSRAAAEKQKSEGAGLNTPAEKRIVRITTEGDWAPDHAILKGATLDELKALTPLSSLKTR